LGKERDNSPTSSVSGFSSSTSPDEGTSSTLTTASGFSTTISGVAFLVGEGDFEREAEDISVEQDTRNGDRGRGTVKIGECTTLWTRWRGRGMDLPGATTGDATAAILTLVDGQFHLRCWLIFRGLLLDIRTTWTKSVGEE